MSNQVNSIYIEKLFGEYDYKIELKENKLVLVAPNGSGKTTVLRIIYHYLSGQWEKLKSSELKAINAVINGQKIGTYSVAKKAELRVSLDKKQQLLERHIEQEKALKELLEIPIEKLQNTPFIIQEIAAKYDAHEPLLRKIVKDLVQEELEIKTLPLSNLQVLFLPTYRRIEQNVNDVFPDFAKQLTSLLRDNIDGISNLIEGELKQLEDLRATYNKKETALEKKEFIQGEGLDWLTKELLERENTDYSKTELELIEEIDNYWMELNKPNKTINHKQNLSYEELIGFGMDDVEFLLQDQYRKINSGDTKAKELLDLFVDKCAKFIVNKKIAYHKSKGVIELKIKGKEDGLGLAHLSSGEKQLMSLFANIIFSQRSTFLIIDEPELSLSIQWQEQLLEELVTLPKLEGLIVATHSHSIAIEKFDDYLSGLNRFKVL